MRGDIEAIYDAMSKPIGMMSFAPIDRARGSMFSARSRLGLGSPHVSPVIPEEQHLPLPKQAPRPHWVVTTLPRTADAQNDGDEARAPDPSRSVVG